MLVVALATQPALVDKIVISVGLAAASLASACGCEIAASDTSCAAAAGPDAPLVAGRERA